MEKKSLFGYALALLMAVTLVVTQCVTTNPETGTTEFVSIEDMTQPQFTAFQDWVRISTRLAGRQLLGSQPNLVPSVQFVVEKGHGLLNTDTVSLTHFVEVLTSEVSNLDVRDFILASLALVELNGGFPYQDKVNKILTERGVDILRAILDGMEGAIPVN